MRLRVSSPFAALAIFLALCAVAFVLLKALGAPEFLFGWFGAALVGTFAAGLFADWRDMKGAPHISSVSTRLLVLAGLVVVLSAVIAFVFPDSPGFLVVLVISLVMAAATPTEIWIRRRSGNEP